MIGLGEMHRMKLGLHTVCIFRIFYILKGSNLPLVFKLREIRSVDSEENLPPDARF